MLQATNFQVEGSRGYKQPQYFKMILHPGRFAEIHPEVSIPLVRLYADYLGYLFGHTISHLERYLGFDPWLAAGEEARIVLTHPNHWTSDQQHILREATVTAGLVSPEGIENMLHFVEEAEAAAAFALLEHPGIKNTLKTGAKFIVCDAGGSTVDMSSYVVKRQRSPGYHAMEISELVAPFSVDAGGIYVDRDFSMHLARVVVPYLLGIPQELPLLLDDAMAEFERYSKRRFAALDDTMDVKFGPRALQIPQVGVHKGTLKLPGPVAASFFQSSIKATIASFVEVVRKQDPSVIILTGGFSESLYFKRMIRESLEVNPGCRIILANHPTSKAVVVGALALTHDADRSIRIKRKPRRWQTWLSKLFAH
ncbi:hypothetical protein DL93DRAFT_591057 [Clavulina sp. PMI_390]|nr:hypothetical protein DL93DRAFT_591057 [Clavulina sp. PMI_390]